MIYATQGLEQNVYRYFNMVNDFVCRIYFLVFCNTIGGFNYFIHMDYVHCCLLLFILYKPFGLIVHIIVDNSVKIEKKLLITWASSSLLVALTLFVLPSF